MKTYLVIFELLIRKPQNIEVLGRHLRFKLKLWYTDEFTVCELILSIKRTMQNLYVLEVDNDPNGVPCPGF
jgi:hypothetical protein